MRVDAHQHFWTPSLLEALAVRTSLPYVRRSDGVMVLHCAGERPWVIDASSETPAQRAELLRADDVDVALIALSSALGIEALGHESSIELIDAHLDGAEMLGSEFALWGPVALDQPDPDDIDAVLARGCVGISIPAGAIAGLAELDGVGPLLERASRRGVPVFIHPGPAPDSSCPRRL